MELWERVSQCPVFTAGHFYDTFTRVDGSRKRVPSSEMGKTERWDGMGEYRRQEDESKLFAPVVSKGQNETKKGLGTERTSFISTHSSAKSRNLV